MIWASSALGGGAGGWGISVVIRMSLYEFRSVQLGKEFLNRIELSSLVQDLLTVGDLGSLQLWGGADGCGGIWGRGAPRHVHTCVLICPHMKCYNQHVRKLQMATTMEAAMFIMFNTCMCVCAHICSHACMCMCVHMSGGLPPPNLTPTTHPPTHPPQGAPHNQ